MVPGPDCRPPEGAPAAIRGLLQAVGLLAGDSGDEIEVLIDVED